MIPRMRPSSSLCLPNFSCNLLKCAFQKSSILILSTLSRSNERGWYDNRDEMPRQSASWDLEFSKTLFECRTPAAGVCGFIAVRYTHIYRSSNRKDEATLMLYRCRGLLERFPNNTVKKRTLLNILFRPNCSTLLSPLPPKGLYIWT